MFKDYDKYLNASLKVYIFVLVLIFIMKLVGLDYFGLEVDNPTIVKINNFCLKYKIDHVWQFITLYIQLYLYLCLVCKKKKLYSWALFGTVINILTQIIITKIEAIGILYVVVSFSIMFIIPMIINKKISFLRQIFYLTLISVYQLISLFVRNIGINENYTNYVIDSLLNIDQIIMLMLTYIIVFKKGEKICLLEAGYSSLKKINLKNLPKKLQENWRNFKKQDKVTKLTFIIYFILSLIWNIFTIITVLFAAMLNDTLIECIFILTSFWLSKREFGKAFHLSSMIQCFIVSNLTYYVLNRITTPLGISILIPIMLGVGLSYVTSKLVKETYKPLYKGMPKEVFENTILKVVDKDSHKYKICYDFYINGKSDLSISLKYNYSVAGIRKIKNRVNDKIKRL
ncbi:MAG: accessory gene regulator B family protein [Bacilli bacterium]|nr:accessory gene regulator B family protein [Bacilli bacterium]